MNKTTKIVRTIYLYTVALISLVFLAVGTGNLINTTLKAYIFTEAEKNEYSRCTSYPYFVSSIDAEAVKKNTQITEDQKTQIDNMLKEYENWKKENTGDVCIKAERQKKMLDAVTMILIALPLYVFHWRMARKEKQETEN
ncbi:MAG: hypothetical protein WC468_03170 [Candidatus Paceibacterota bacterium]